MDGNGNHSRRETPARPGDEERAPLIRRMLLRATEAAVALVLVMVFFLGFMVIIGLAFPQGTSLRELMLDPNLGSRSRGPTRLDLQLGQGREAPSVIVAELTRIHRTVKNRRSSAIVWSRSQAGMPLEDRHSVQTYSRSGAQISFGNDNKLELEEKSLIVIRRAEGAERSARRKGSVLLLQGTLDGNSDEDDASRIPLEVVTAGGSSLFVPAGSRSADFRVAINPDRTSTYSVRNGSAEVVSGGRRVRLGPDQWVTVAGDEAPGVPRRLPRSPSVLAPADGATFVYRSAPPRVRFDWDDRQDVDGYRIEISKDPDFDDLAYRARLEETEFVHGNLPSGRYYWRVAGLQGWAIAEDAEVRSLEILRDLQPPELEIAFPSHPVGEPTVELSGITEPGASVFVGNRNIPTNDSGEFTCSIELRPGPNVVVVEAVDPAGNVAHRSQTLVAKYQEVKVSP